MIDPEQERLEENLDKLIEEIDAGRVSDGDTIENQGQRIVIHIDDTPETTPIKRRKRWLLAFIFCWLVLLLVILSVCVPRMLAPTTITIMPTTRQISTQITIPGRSISLTISQQQVIQATGRGHQGAQAAHGTVTLYNSQLYAQTIPAGTLVGNVTTDYTVTIPGANYPTFGQVSVSAHSVVTGPDGNVRAGALYGPCCRAGVSISNSIFTGGQDSRDYQMVTQSDIDQAVNTITGSLDQSVQVVFNSQAHLNETLSSVDCKPKVTTSKKPREEAEQITVAIDAHCTSQAYPTQQLQGLLAVDGYSLIGDVSVVGKEVSGTVAYHFSQAELDQMKRQIAGKGETSAKQILLGVTGVRSVSLIGDVPGDVKKRLTDARTEENARFFDVAIAWVRDKGKDACYIDGAIEILLMQTTPIPEDAAGIQQLSDVATTFIAEFDPTVIVSITEIEDARTMGEAGRTSRD